MQMAASQKLEALKNSVIVMAMSEHCRIDVALDCRH